MYPDCAVMCADDYRLFCGDLGNEVNDDVISKAFSRFPSFNMAKVSFVALSFLTCFQYNNWLTIYEPFTCSVQIFL